MIPLRDSVPSRTFPCVNLLLVGACAGVFVLQVLQGAAGEDFASRYGFVPASLFHPALVAGLVHRPEASASIAVSAAGTLVTSMFLHGGLLHLLGNLLYLWIFGDNVEDELGHGRYLLFYLGAGVSAALLQGALAPASTVPMIGASGAIAGVLGAYFVLHPRARIVTLVPLFLLFPLVEVPAWLYLLFWFLMQFWMGTASLAARAAGAAGEGGVAWWAHVGGFLSGVLLLALLRPRRRPVLRYSVR